jgi:hypothetical protein
MRGALAGADARSRAAEEKLTLEVGVVHKTSALRGFHIHASDGTVGHVDDFLIDEASWILRYLVVDTSNWIGGRSVLISGASILRIDPVKQEIYVGLSREEIKNGPSIEAADIPLVETLPTVWIM